MKEKWTKNQPVCYIACIYLCVCVCVCACVCMCVYVCLHACTHFTVLHVAKETTLNQGLTSLFGERKTATNSMVSSNPFGSLGNISDSKNE